MSRWFTLALLLATSLALALRCPNLGQRPMHNDEGVNGVKFGRLWETGRYVYDPNEHHGPTLYYATAALSAITGAPGIDKISEARLRAVPLLFGIGLILLLFLIRDAVGSRAAAWAAFLTAVSPAFTYYSRYYIHEMLLVFFAFLAIGAGWRYWRSRKVGWALMAGVAVGLMHATKETFVLSLGAMGLALGLCQVWNRLLDATGLPVKAPKLKASHVAAGAGAWIFVAVLFFTSFGTNAAGPLDSIRTYLPWLQRAAGDSPHIHSWKFYWERLLFFHAPNGPLWSEGLVLVLALFGISAGFRRQELGNPQAGFVRFVAFYTIILAGVYSLIGYKTPWCLLNFWHGAIVLAGVGAVVLIRLTRYQIAKAAAIVFLALGLAQMGMQARAASQRFASDRRNPYVYAHTSADFHRLTEKIRQLAAASPATTNTLVKVIGRNGDFWPLPWYLRDFKQVGWWENLPEDPFAPIMVVSADLNAQLDRDGTHLMVGYFELRPQVFLELYVEEGLWTSFLAKNPPPKD